MPDYRCTNRGKSVGVLTLSANYPAVNYNELIAPNVKSTATVQAFYFSEPRFVYINDDIILLKPYGPGRVTLTELGVTPTADFSISTWEQPIPPKGYQGL